LILDSAEASIVVQQKVACVESFALERVTVAWNEKPMANLVAEQHDRADGRKLAAKFRIGGIRTVRKDKPDAIIPGRFIVIPEHANDAVCQVDGKAGKHLLYFRVQLRERLQDKCMRRVLSSFGGVGHDYSGRAITDSVRIRLDWRESADAGRAKNALVQLPLIMVSCMHPGIDFRRVPHASNFKKGRRPWQPTPLLCPHPGNGLRTDL